MKANFQPGIHPDADQLSVFVEGAASSHEHERMLAHLAECAECRKAVFLMQPHEETQARRPEAVKGWMWRRLLPVALPAAALACAVIALVVYLRPHGGSPEVLQQNASVRQPEIPRPPTTVAPTTESESFARSENPNKSSAPNAAAPNFSRETKHPANGLHLPEAKNQQIAANIASPPTALAAPSASAPVAGVASVSGAISSGTVSDLPLNARNFTGLQQLTPGGTKGASSQNSLATKKELPPLEIEGAGGRDATLAGISGRVTDPTGAVVAGATITLRDASGKTRQTTTGTDGSFHLAELPAGRYDLMATATGFKTKQQSIELKASEVAMMQPVLDVGTVSEAVEVSGAAPTLETESASVSRIMPVPSGLPVTTTVSLGKRSLSLDSAGNLFLSRNGGKKWKKINPRWTGMALRIELKPPSDSGSSPKRDNETLGSVNATDVFQLTTDAGAVWTSKDGTHWHQQ
ncbi:MAG: carboxypeptidase regulatory-like domain-containing protein [Candidatus Sulfotelmatobacter sp.]